MLYIILLEIPKNQEKYLLVLPAGCCVGYDLQNLCWSDAGSLLLSSMMVRWSSYLAVSDAALSVKL